jgi:cysteine desulfuration protein SufE
MLEERMSEVLDTFKQAKEMEAAGMEYLTYRSLIDSGKKLEPFPEGERTEENLVTKCTSTVHLIGQKRDGRMHYVADSDAAFVKGELAILMGLFNGLPPEAIVSPDTATRFREFFNTLSQYISISMNRQQGFFGMYERIREIARRHVS